MKGEHRMDCIAALLALPCVRRPSRASGSHSRTRRQRALGEGLLGPHSKRRERDS